MTRYSRKGAALTRLLRGRLAQIDGTGGAPSTLAIVRNSSAVSGSGVSSRTARVSARPLR